MDNSKLFKLRIITPERVFYEGDVSMVEFNTTEGEIGIYKGHIPMTVIVDPGILSITEPDQVQNAALHAGFAEILPESVTILAEIVEWPNEINLERAEIARERAEKRLLGRGEDTDLARARVALKRAVCRIEIMK